MTNNRPPANAGSQPVAQPVPRFQLLQWKYAVELESRGMKHSSGRSVRKHAALALGLPPRSPAEVVIAAINEQLCKLPRNARAICDDCEAVIDTHADPRALLEDPWGRPTGYVLCEACRERRWDRQQEGLAEG